MDVKHRMIVFDAADIDAESAFWAGLLGGTVVEDGPRWRNIWVDGEWHLGVQLAPDHVQPEWPDGTPQQVHFDFYVVGIEGLDAAHTEITGLGGRLLNLPAIARPREESRRTPTPPAIPSASAGCPRSDTGRSWMGRRTSYDPRGSSSSATSVYETGLM